jgi:hypothetical protein
MIQSRRFVTSDRLTGQERAAVAGALRHYIARWRDGKRRPTASYYAAIRALAKFTGKPVKVRP